MNATLHHPVTNSNKQFVVHGRNLCASLAQMAGSLYSDLEHNQRWLVSMRRHLGWSAEETAKRIKAVSARANEPLSTTQQTVSAFENGKIKSNPRWLGYAQLAMLEDMRSKGLHEGAARELRLPEPSVAFFEELQQKFEVEDPWSEFLDEPRGTNYSSEMLDQSEVEVLELWRSLEPQEQGTVLSLLRSLAGPRRGHTLHSEGRGYLGAR